jgi:hypothetical protein
MSIDKNSKFPDNSGFHFDLSPAVRTGQQRGEHFQPRNTFYGTWHIENSGEPGWKEWGNWTTKFQPDVRFAAISDKNAWLQAFPEVDAPWKFIDYTYKGTGGGTGIIEPELYSPQSLNQINSQGIMGKLDGTSFGFYQTLYRYQHEITGNIFTQEQLEKNGWKDPSATTDKRCFKRIDAYKKRFCFNYPSRNKGVRLYRHRLEVESKKWGQHGNIPPQVINMMSPKEYFEPDNIFSSVIVPKVTATAGSRVTASNDGVINYTAGPVWRGLKKITIDPIDTSSITEVAASGTRFAEWSFTSVGNPVQQQSPNMSKDTALDIKFIGGNFSDGDWVHKGCKFWRGNTGGTVTCSIANDIPAEDDPNVPDPVKCPYYKAEPSGPSPTEEYKAIGGLCPYYSPTGPQKIATYEANAATTGEYAAMFAGIENYSDGGGANNHVNGGAMFSGSNTPIGGGTAAYGGFALGAAAALKTPTSLPRELSDVDVRYDVTYEYQRIPALGRETVRELPPYQKPDYENFVRGTGRFAFDEKDTNYNGVDSHLFGERNMMSAWRFNHSTMPCYNASKCNTAYGFQMTQGYIRGIHAGVGEEDHCRYYTKVCPHMTVPRRAYEYDRTYVNSMQKILYPFRIGGIESFGGLTQHEVTASGLFPAPSGIDNGVYAAVGPSGYFDVDSLDIGGGDFVYFYYDTPVAASGHMDSNLYCHIEQYNHENQKVYMELPPSGQDAAPSGYPSNVPWLTKLYDDYRSPNGFTFFVTNEKRFFGGRNPEYKDRSKMDPDEVLVPAAQGGGTQDTTNGGKGGDPNHAVQDKGFFRGYWIDRSGEFIIDGRPLGNVAASGYTLNSEYFRGLGNDPATNGYSHEVVGIGSRLQKVPPISLSATPIAGATSNSIITPEKSISAKVTRLYIYSSDTREILGCDAMNDQVNEFGNPVPPASVTSGHLPLERTYFRCPSCSYSHYKWPTPTHPSPVPSGYVEPDPSGVSYDPDFPSVDQIFTDHEAESLEYQCPVCNSILGYQGYWENFPHCSARGVATIFGLPGMSVRNDGYYFKNSPLITRSFVSEITGKLGPTNPGGFGYTLHSSSSANGETEASVAKLIRPSGSIWKQGLPEPSGRWSNDSFTGYTPITTEDKDDKDDTIAQTLSEFSRDEFGAAEADMLEYIGMTSPSGARLDGGEYDDRIISPYDKNVPGLDLFTIDHLKALRNKLMPMYAYSIGQSGTKDFYSTKQPSHKERYSKTEGREWSMKPGTLPPQIMAATSNGHDNYAQYWDGQIPGTTIYEYFPSGPTWWRIFQNIGGISREGGISETHLDDSDGGAGYLSGYTGDRLISKAFFFLHGYVPLDKDVVKAYAIITPKEEPEKPPIGITWSGRILFHHYHAFRTDHEDAGYAGHWEGYELESDDENVEVESQPINPIYAKSGFDDYVSYIWDRPDEWNSIMEFTRGYHDVQFGTDSYEKSWSNYLSWEGTGNPLIQNLTEEQLWKNYTYEGFKDIIQRDTMKCRFIAGNEAENTFYDFYMFSRRLLGQIFNQETQPISGMFDLTGMNDTLFYPRTGPIFEPKISNTSWANGGQIIIQGDNSFDLQNSSPLGGLDETSGNTSNWSSGGMGVLNAGWQQRVLDITEVVKKRYNERLARAFRPQLGISYESVHDTVKQIRYDETFSPSDNPPDQGVNYRVWNDSYGQWLNDPWHFPKLVADEFPVLPLGDPYEFDPTKRISQVSSWWIDPDANDEEHPDYYKYHPRQLITSSSQNFQSGLPPASGIPSPSGYWYVLSDYSYGQSFELDLRGFPIESSRRPWRYESGYWDVSNVVCPNGNCPIGFRNQTVSEFIEWSQSVPGKATTVASTTSPFCAVSGDSLISAPATGAQFVGGDGILTVRYRELPQKDPFVSAIKVSSVGDFLELSSFKQGFSIQAKSSTGTRYRTILNVQWLEQTGKWRWPEYNSNGILVYKTGDNLPSFFTGVWIDAEDVSNVSSSELNGKNFIAPKARYIRYTSSPIKQTIHHPSPGGAPLASGNMSSNPYEFLNPSGIKQVYDGKWQGGTLQISYDFESEEVYEAGVISNYPSGFFIDEAISASGVWILPSAVQPTPSGAPNWRIEKDFYISSCGKIEVYGYDVEENQLTMTGDARTHFTVFSIGSNSITLPEFPTRIMSVRSGIQDVSSIELYEVESLSDTNFIWKTETRNDPLSGQDYQYVIGGSYFFDRSAIATIVPSRWKNDDTGESGSIWSLNNNLDPENFEIQTIPQFIEVRYFTGIGLPITVDCKAVGSGPSYQVEKEAVHVIQGYEETGTNTPGGIPETTGNLPNLGKTVKLGSGFSTKKDLKWQVYNHSPLYGRFEMGYLIGNELGASQWQESDIANLFGGDTQENPGAATKISGTVEGELTFYGAPNSIISGEVYCYAPALTQRKYNVDGNEVVTWERTGGLKYTGFSVGVELEPVTDNRQGICFSLPKILVYLKERDNKIEPEMD